MGHGYFPAGEPAVHVRSMAYPRALDLSWQGVTEGRVAMLLPFSSRIADADGSRIDLLAIIGAIDHACSAAVYAALHAPQLIATVDLRIEMAGPVDDHADVKCEAWTSWSDAQWAFTRAEARCGKSGRLVAQASSSYLKGAHPGSAKSHNPPPIDTALRNSAAERPVGMAGLLGIGHGDNSSSMPFHDALVGAQSLPALHGGATSALLAAAAIDAANKHHKNEAGLSRKLLTLSVQFLRAAAARETFARVDLVKQGARMDVYTVTAEQGEANRPVARAECIISAA